MHPQDRSLFHLRSSGCGGLAERSPADLSGGGGGGGSGDESGGREAAYVLGYMLTRTDWLFRVFSSRTADHSSTRWIRLRIMSHHMESCVMIITETWLDNNIPDAAIEIGGRSVYQADRTIASGKRKGGGVCIYVHNNWCTATNIIGTHCSPDLEYLVVKCRPFHMPREFSSILIIAVYIPPQANAKLALEELHTAINNQLNTQPETVMIVAGDFNHVELKAVLPKFYKNINFLTRGNNILDQVYTNIPGAYKAAASSHLGMSDHIALEMIPAYKPLICRARPTVKTVQVWGDEATSMLQDCFEHTDWDVFKEDADLEEYISAVLAYVHFCTDTVLPTKTISVSKPETMAGQYSACVAQSQRHCLQVR